MFYGRKRKCRRQEKRKLIDGGKKIINMDMATKEVQPRGSLFDRIMSLENQLTQLSMEMEYCRTSGASISDASSSSGFKVAERIYSYPTFNNPLATYNLIKRHPLQVDDISKLNFQKESQNPLQQELKHSTSIRQHPKKNGEHKTSSNTRRKSKIASSRPKMRLLGC